MPTNLDVMLHAWDSGFDEKAMQNGLSDADGRFAFESVPLNPAWVYAVMLTYDDVLYFSEPMPLSEGTTTLTMDVAVYEKTSATNAVQVERQHVFFDTASGGLMVGEIYILSNLGDRTITGSSGDDAPISPLQFSLPENAASVTFEEEKTAVFCVRRMDLSIPPRCALARAVGKLLCVMCCPMKMA